MQFSPVGLFYNSLFSLCRRMKYAGNILPVFAFMLVQFHEEIIPRMPLSYVLGHSIITGFYGNKDSKKIFEKLSFFGEKRHYSKF